MSRPANLVIDVSVSAEWKRSLRAPAAVCSRAAAAAFEAVAKSRRPKARDVELAVVLTSDAAVKRLNAAYRGKNKPTDVLSFPAWLGTDTGDGREAILGDVVVAKGVSARDAKAERKGLDEHLAHLVVHGVLHLLGYDHEDDADARAMERLEIAVLKTLGIANPYLAREKKKRAQKGGGEGIRAHGPRHEQPTMSESSPRPTPSEKPRLMRRLKRWLDPKTEDAETVRDVIEELIEERIEESAEGDAAIDPNERLLLSNVLALRDVTARDIMVPRADIVAIEASTPLSEALALLTRGGHSRLPVYRDSLDEILGLIHIKDLAVFAIEHSLQIDVAKVPLQKRTLIDMVRSVLFVSPAVRVLDLLLEMRLKRTHMALVVDEYGGIDGLLTIEDVVEQIVGEIEDEHDIEEAPQLRDGPDGTLLADARLPLTDFEARVGHLFTDEEREQADTVGGLVISIAGRVPGRGALVKHNSGIEFEVIDSDPRRVRQLRIRNLPAPTPAK